MSSSHVSPAGSRVWVGESETKAREVNRDSIMKGCGHGDLALLSQKVLTESSGIFSHS